MADGARLGVDIGGTFTDVVVERAGARRTLKLLTTPDDPARAVVEGVERLCSVAGVVPTELSRLIHGTTLATNALIERKGARTALVATKGFRDVIELRTESRFEQYDLNIVLPEPLIPREDRLVLDERIAADGTVLRPLARTEIEALAEEIAARGYEAVAVGLMHAYANPAHERLVAEVLAARLPGLDISLSSEVSPKMREYERFATTAANAYVRPLMRAYLGRLAGEIAGLGVGAPVHLMHSGGGILDMETASRFPVRLVESGPAGGAIFAADLARRHGFDRVLSFDMGGTTAKICLIRDYTPRTAQVFEVARSYRFKKGSGMPISIPVIEMVEIGAGGGSIARVDAMGQIRVGPDSAGADPGPACYGRGGTAPTVTDADLLLGRIDPANFAGGEIPLDRAAAERAVAGAVGAPLGLDAVAAALGISEVVDETMANAARMHAVESGEDLATFTMIAFGGAAPLHAARLCGKLGIGAFLVPPGAGVGSAIGFLRAPFSFEAARSALMRLDTMDVAAARALFTELEAEARRFVEAAAPGVPLVCERRAFMRYRGQGWEIPVVFPEDAARAPTPETCRTLFERAYAALFGRPVEGVEIEIASWAVNVATETAPEAPLTPPAPRPAPASAARRPLVDGASGARVEAAVYRRETLGRGTRLDGPALIEEAQTTVVVPPGATASVAADGSILVTLGEERAS